MKLFVCSTIVDEILQCKFTTQHTNFASIFTIIFQQNHKLVIIKNIKTKEQKHKRFLNISH